MSDFNDMATTSDRSHIALDIGNTYTKVGLFRGESLLQEPLRLAHDAWEELTGVVTNHKAEYLIYSSVANVPPPGVIARWESFGTQVVELTAQMPLPFASLYRTMETLGPDRIAGVAGARARQLRSSEQHPSGIALNTAGASPRPGTAPALRRPNVSPAFLTVDAGTCVTLDLLGGDGVYHGGNISPGLHMRLRAMHDFTAKLPNPGVGPVQGRVGDATPAALRHGAALGTVYEIEGLFARLEPDFPGLRVLLTGGDAAWLNERLSVPRTLCPHLVLHGLIQILSTYVRNKK